MCSQPPTWTPYGSPNSPAQPRPSQRSPSPKTCVRKHPFALSFKSPPTTAQPPSHILPYSLSLTCSQPPFTNPRPPHQVRLRLERFWTTVQKDLNRTQVFGDGDFGTHVVGLGCLGTGRAESLHRRLGAHCGGWKDVGRIWAVGGGKLNDIVLPISVQLRSTLA